MNFFTFVFSERRNQHSITLKILFILSFKKFKFLVAKLSSKFNFCRLLTVLKVINKCTRCRGRLVQWKSINFVKFLHQRTVIQTRLTPRVFGEEFFCNTQPRVFEKSGLVSQPWIWKQRNTVAAKIYLCTTGNVAQQSTTVGLRPLI